MTIAPDLPRSAPEAQGIPSSAILSFVEAAEQHLESLHSLMLVRHGQVVAEGWWAPYGPGDIHMLYSLSKSFTSTAIGLAVAEGLLSLDDLVWSFFPDDAPAETTEFLAAMQVRHLLSMSTGHGTDTMSALHQRSDGNWVRAFLSCPVEYAPGTHFLYNTGATYMLSAILQGLTGETLLEYLRPRLLAPLGIERATWETCPRGISTGGFGLSITTDAIARFGQLYLQGGEWRGQQLVPRAWVEEATAWHISNGSDPDSDWAQGYGYQFWRCRHGAYRGDGAFGQFCVVLPEQDAVLAITSGLGPMQPVLDLVWEHLLPAMAAAPLPANDASRAALATKLSQLALPLPQAVRRPAQEALVAGNYRFENTSEGVPFQLESLSLSFDDAGYTLTLRDPQGDHVLIGGSGAWHTGSTAFISRGETSLVAAAGAWVSEDTLVFNMYYYETPFCGTFTLRFVEDRLLLTIGLNVSFGPTTFPELVGVRGS